MSLTFVFTPVPWSLPQPPVVLSDEQGAAYAAHTKRIGDPSNEPPTRTWDGPGTPLAVIRERRGRS